MNQIESVLLNILINARSLIEDAGTLAIAGAAKTLNEMRAAVDDIATDGRFIELTISDTGHGMPVEILDRRFSA